ncbi:hypothetical protein C0Q44_20205 [Paenibacillus sp. PCH8]|uniref:hypothetical protein n=1 Tax=Paenibacillus sp. PCH8 TaxID=2066524 RepID=UPI000CFA7012|nr:hypothetical protein [Paenibacillus sp. PCH8]PQP81987.1 hypothetical protein C0Q44_20205 [Paenibacillus sp. PCH8]
MSKQEIYTAAQWTDYIEGHVSEHQASRMEQLLIEDPDAMEIYLDALDIQREMPSLHDPKGFTDSVMHRIEGMQTSKTQRKSRSGRNRRWLEHKVFHYAVAACLTVIFLSSGLFDKVAPYHKFQDGDHRGSFTEKWTETATSWLDNFKPKP